MQSRTIALSQFELVVHLHVSSLVLAVLVLLAPVQEVVSFIDHSPVAKLLKFLLATSCATCSGGPNSLRSTSRGLLQHSLQRSGGGRAYTLRVVA